MMDKIKVFLSDPQVLFREGIHFILSGEEDFEVTGETTSNEEAFTLIEGNPPNVAVLGMQDSKVEGPEITRRIKRTMSAVSVILTADRKEDDKLFAAIRAGASACLTKDIDPEQLLDVIRDVAQGGLPITDELLKPGLASMVLDEFEDLAALNEQVDNLLAGLTPKESQVISNIAAGSTLEQLAARLDMNEESIRRTLRAVLSKMNANDQARILIEAAQRSLPSIIRSSSRRDSHSSEYITKAEFNEFKDTLMERLKSFIGELS